MSKTQTLLNAMRITEKTTTKPATSELAPVPPVSEITTPESKTYKGRPTDETPTFVSIRTDVRDAMDELAFRSKRPLKALAQEAFIDLLEKYRHPIGR
jgi:hypothetical protein